MLYYDVKTKWGKISTGKVRRICDNCGKEEIVEKIEPEKARKKRGSDKDYCKKCGYIFRKTPILRGEMSPLWKGGVSLNDNGYLRRTYYDENGNKIKCYEHKYIYEKHLGRKLSKTEKVHHIDNDKLNNNIGNMYLCKDKRSHYHIHYQLEQVGYSLLRKKIWFDRKDNIYILDYREDTIFDKSEKTHNVSCNCLDGNGKKYAYVYVAYRTHKRLHRMLMEDYLGRELNTNEHVHHIDGNTLNNDMNNLVLLDRSKHKLCHNSLQNLVLDLYKNDIVGFDKKLGKYYVL